MSKPLSRAELALILNTHGRFSVLTAKATGHGQRRTPRLRLQVGPLSGVAARALAEGMGDGAHARCRDRAGDRWLVEVRGPRVEELGLEVVDILSARATATFTAALDLIEEVRARRASALRLAPSRTPSPAFFPVHLRA